VEASVAIPGYFSPVVIDGDRYVDGGARSVTNADLVAGLGFDLVVVIAPMTAVPAAVRPPTRHLSRALHARVLASEVRSVRRSGTPVLVIQPTGDDIAELGPSLHHSSAAPAARCARRSAVARLQRPDASAALAILEAAASRDPGVGPAAVASAS
jgi:NTE family protein